MVKRVAEVEVKVTGEQKSISKLKKFTNFVKRSFVITLGDVVRIGRAVVKVFTDMSKAASKQEDAVNTLNQALKNQGIFTEENTRLLQEQAAAMQKVTTFGDEEIIMLQSQLVNFGIAKDRIDDVTKATLDLAVSQGMSLFGAGQLLSKSLGSTTNALSRYGIEIEGAVGSNERLNSAISNIASKFGGQAKAASETFAGATSQLNNNWGDLQETLGQVANEQLKPLLVTLSELTVKTNEFLKSFAGGDELDQAEKKLASLRNGLKALKVSPLDIFGVQKEEKAKRAKAVEEQEALVKKLRDAKIQADKDIIISDNTVSKLTEANKNKKIALLEEELKVTKGVSEDITSILTANEEERGKVIGNIIKKRLVAEIDAFIAAEIGKLTAAAPATFGASLLGIAPVLGAAAVARGAINGIQFAQGGQLETKTVGGQSAIAGEAGMERVTVEPIGQPESSSAGNMTANITVMLGDKELKTIATQLKPYMDAKNRGVY